VGYGHLLLQKLHLVLDLNRAFVRKEIETLHSALRSQVEPVSEELGVAVAEVSEVLVDHAHLPKQVHFSSA